MGEMCDFGCGESTKWAFLEFTTELSNFRKNPGTCRPREPWIFSPHARHRVRSPRKGRDAACRVRGPPARYVRPRAHAQRPLQATGISDQRWSGPLWPASGAELKSPASVPPGGRAEAAREPVRAARKRDPAAACSPLPTWRAVAAKSWHRGFSVHGELERASLGCPRQRPILQRCLQGRPVESRLARRPGEAARARNLHAFFLRCSRRWESVLQSRPVDPMISLWVLLVRTRSVCSVLENCLHACRIGVSRER